MPRACFSRAYGPVTCTREFMNESMRAADSVASGVEFDQRRSRSWHRSPRDAVRIVRRKRLLRLSGACDGTCPNIAVLWPCGIHGMFMGSAVFTVNCGDSVPSSATSSAVLALGFLSFSSVAAAQCCARRCACGAPGCGDRPGHTATPPAVMAEARNPPSRRSFAFSALCAAGTSYALSYEVRMWRCLWPMLTGTQHTLWTSLFLSLTLWVSFFVATQARSAPRSAHPARAHPLAESHGALGPAGERAARRRVHARRVLHGHRAPGAAIGARDPICCSPAVSAGRPCAGPRMHHAVCAPLATRCDQPALVGGPVGRDPLRRAAGADGHHGLPDEGACAPRPRGAASDAGGRVGRTSSAKARSQWVSSSTILCPSSASA